MTPRQALLPALLAVALLLIGCADSVAARIAQRQELFDAYPAEVQARIARGQIRLGDDRDAVWMVYGDPAERLTRTDAAGLSEVWIYKILGFSDRLYPAVRPVYHDIGGHLRGGYYIDDAPEYEWKEALRVEFRDGRVSAVQMRE